MQTHSLNLHRTTALVSSSSTRRTVGSMQINARLNVAAPTLVNSQLARPALAMHRSARSTMVVKAQGGDGDKEVKYNTEFGYSRKDVILIGVGIIALGYAMYYGLQAAGVDAIMAGNYVQLFIFIGICIGWIGSYLFRVANKDMTYVKQLADYEEAVMKKRLEEMPESELEKLMDDVQQQQEDKK